MRQEIDLPVKVLIQSQGWTSDLNFFSDPEFLRYDLEFSIKTYFPK